MGVIGKGGVESCDTLVTQSEGKIEVPEGFLWEPRVMEIKEL